MEFNRANKQVLAALLRLRSPEMAPLLEFFNKQLDDAKTSLIRADGPYFHRVQGRAGYLDDLLTAVHSAAENLEKLK